MTHDTFLTLSFFVAVSAGTPGPNNLMMLTSSLQVGLYRTLPLWFGIQLGFVILFVVVASGLGFLFQAYPQTYTVLKWGGVVWLLYLSWKVAAADPAPIGHEEEAEPPMGFLGAIAFQWINPKSWVFALSTLAAYGDPLHYWRSIAVILAVIVAVGMPVGSLWALAGVALRRLLSTRERMRVFNRGMGVALALSVLPMVVKTS